MLKLKFFIVLLFLFIKVNLQVAYSEEKSCAWDNKNEFPCLEIEGHISNTSKFSLSGVNKVIISKSR